MEKQGTFEAFIHVFMRALVFSMLWCNISTFKQKDTKWSVASLTCDGSLVFLDRLSDLGLRGLVQVRLEEYDRHGETFVGQQHFLHPHEHLDVAVHSRRRLEKNGECGVIKRNLLCCIEIWGKKRKEGRRLFLLFSWKELMCCKSQLVEIRCKNIYSNNLILK